MRPVGKLGIVDWREDCSSCHNCVKRDCVYGLYGDESQALREELGYLDYIYQCKGCLNCIQDCTKGILTRVVNPEYEKLGDEYYTPEIIVSSWYQAATGGIPVSGSGYGGPFSGKGFDAMWTDMSEIVRPTRDGIHGREYICTSIDIGRKLKHLTFDNGQPTATPPPLLEIPLPVIFDVLPERFLRGPIMQAVAKTAAEIGTLFVARQADAPRGLSFEEGNAVPLFGPEDDASIDTAAPMVMVTDSEDAMALHARIKESSSNRIVAIRVEASPAAGERVCALVRGGAEVIHLVFDAHGREKANANSRHMRDVLREVHGMLTKEGTRDQITVIASGGIALAEHMAKAIICGADLVAIDLPLIVALECRLCGECERGEVCQVGLADTEEAQAVQRMVNLIGAWRNQLLELLGAMGIREACRLRGETGRAMFFEDLEAATFGRLFGKRKDGV